jgi:hypothetical protein
MTDASMRYIRVVADVDTMRPPVHLGQYRRWMQLVYGERVRMIDNLAYHHPAFQPLPKLLR